MIIAVEIKAGKRYRRLAGTRLPILLLQTVSDPLVAADVVGLERERLDLWATDRAGPATLLQSLTFLLPLL